MRFAAFASQGRGQWAAYVLAQLPTGRFLDARDFRSTRGQAFIETALILMRIMCEKEVAAAPKGSPKPFVYHSTWPYRQLWHFHRPEAQG